MEGVLCVQEDYSLTTTVIFYVYCATPIHALDAIGSADNSGYLLEEDRVNAIQTLYAERASLATNLEENKEQIIQIDQRLEALGVETISSDELAQKLGENLVTPLANFPSSNTYTTWTSFRTMYVYRGTQYEIQQVTGVSTVNGEEGDIVNSSQYPLLDKKIYSIEKNYGFTVATEELLKFSAKKAGEYIVQTVADGVEVISPKASAAITTVYEGVSIGNEAYQIIQNAMSPTTELCDVSYTCSISMAATESYLFVKTPGNPDVGHQVFVYAGNQIQCTVAISGPIHQIVNGVIKARTIVGQNEYIIESAHYEERFKKAVMLYLDYKQGYTVEDNYILHSFNLELRGEVEDYIADSNGRVVITVYVPRDYAMYDYCW